MKSEDTKRQDFLEQEESGVRELAKFQAGLRSGALSGSARTKVLKLKRNIMARREFLAGFRDIKNLLIFCKKGDMSNVKMIAE